MKQIFIFQLYSSVAALFRTVISTVEQPKEDEEEEEEDTRQMNRKSPNGFLLPDPLPRGEVLTDSKKQVGGVFFPCTLSK